MRTAKALVALVCSISTVAVAVSADDQGRRDRDTKCRSIDGKLASVRVADHCGSPVDFCAVGVITGDGLVGGSFKASAFGFAPSVGLPGLEPETTLSYAGERTIDTTRGTLTLRFTGVFDTARAEFSELERVAAGTGRFEGASGTVWVAGHSIASGTAFEGKVTGEVCLAR
jgi:hypothetical protein